MTTKERIYGMIGLAKRGKYICYGEDLPFRISKGQVKLVIISTDISDKTKKDLDLLIARKELDSMQLFTKEELGSAIGHDPVAANGIKNSGIMKRILELKEEIENNEKKEEL